MLERQPLPRHLQGLVEKRDEQSKGGDRRQEDRRKQDVPVAIERRSGIDRRQRKRRTEDRS